jgi:hypothetical protein
MGESHLQKTLGSPRRPLGLGEGWGHWVPLVLELRGAGLWVKSVFLHSQGKGLREALGSQPGITRCGWTQDRGLSTGLGRKLHPLQVLVHE